MRCIALGLLAGLSAFASISSAAWIPPAGYARTPENFVADYQAIASDGKIAVAFNKTASNPASVKVYASAADAQAAASPLRTFTDANYIAWGDLTFKDNDTILFSENANKDTIYSGSISSGVSSALAPIGSIPNVQGIALNGSTIYATAVNDPGSGAVYTVAGGVATPVLSNIGTGYIGGLAFDSAGTLLVADSNDPNFLGNAGRILRYSAALLPLTPISLAGGGGSGAYDLAVDSEDDIFVTTGVTISQVPHGSTLAQQFGDAMTGKFFFLASLDYAGSGFEPDSGTGKLLVNATNVDEGVILGITPLPEPTSIALLVFAMTIAFVRRRGVRSTAALAASLAVFASFAATHDARADHFYASQVIAASPGANQQQAFTDPALALGGPRGGGTASASIDTYCLGNGGSITLGFDTLSSRGEIHNGVGDDFIVSENSFYQNDDPTRAFAELMWVEASTDGVHFARFPGYSATPSPVGPFGVIDPENTFNFAGVHPVLANVDVNTIDPFDPATAGGDAFDLMYLASDPLVVHRIVDIDHIRYIRLVDVIGNGASLDPELRPIYDPTGNGIGGADVDSIAVIHGTHMPEPAMLLPSIAALSLWRRR